MLYTPKKQKFKKYQKGKAFNKVNLNKIPLKYGQIGLKAVSCSRVTTKQLITLYNNLKKKMKKKGKVIINIFPQSSITKKPTEVRMGKGKGGFSFWAARISVGCTICEVSTVHISFAKKILYDARIKFPLKTKIIYRQL